MAFWSWNKKKDEMVDEVALTEPLPESSSVPFVEELIRAIPVGGKGTKVVRIPTDLGLEYDVYIKDGRVAHLAYSDEEKEKDRANSLLSLVSHSASFDGLDSTLKIINTIQGEGAEELLNLVEVSDWQLLKQAGEHTAKTSIALWDVESEVLWRGDGVGPLNIDAGQLEEALQKADARIFSTPEEMEMRFIPGVLSLSEFWDDSVNYAKICELVESKVRQSENGAAFGELLKISPYAERAVEDSIFQLRRKGVLALDEEELEELDEEDDLGDLFSEEETQEEAEEVSHISVEEDPALLETQVEDAQGEPFEAEHEAVTPSQETEKLEEDDLVADEIEQELSPDKQEESVAPGTENFPHHNEDYLPETIEDDSEIPQLLETDISEVIIDDSPLEYTMSGYKDTVVYEDSDTPIFVALKEKYKM